jgi:hypothetical protein
MSYLAQLFCTAHLGFKAPKFQRLQSLKNTYLAAIHTPYPDGENRLGQLGYGRINFYSNSR